MSQVVGSNNSYKPSPIRRGFTPSFVNYKKGCTQLAATSDKVYQLLAQGRWFSPGTPTSSTTKTGRHDIVEILLKVALNTKIQIQIQSIKKIIIKWKIKKYHAVGAVATSNRKLVESEAKCISLTQIYITAHFPGLVEIVQRLPQPRSKISLFEQLLSQYGITVLGTNTRITYEL